MAKTKAQYLADMMSARLTYPLLANILSSLSKTSFFQSLFALFAEFASNFESLFELHKQSVDDTIASKQVAQKSWWENLCLSFQTTGELVRDSAGNLEYDSADEDSQIVKRVSVSRSGAGLITIKVAKLKSDGITPEPLLTSELEAFTEYIDKTAPFGIVPVVVSVAGDEIKVAMSIQVDPQVINITDGTRLDNTQVKPVEDAIYNYISSFQENDFNGMFYANKLLSAVLSADGVINANFITLEKSASNESTYTNVLTLPFKKFASYAGYVRIANGYSLSDNLNYYYV